MGALIGRSEKANKFKKGGKARLKASRREGGSWASKGGSSGGSEGGVPLKGYEDENGSPECFER